MRDAILPLIMKKFIDLYVSLFVEISEFRRINMHGKNNEFPTLLLISIISYLYLVIILYLLSYLMGFQAEFFLVMGNKYCSLVFLTTSAFIHWWLFFKKYGLSQISNDVEDISKGKMFFHRKIRKGAMILYVTLPFVITFSFLLYKSING